VDQRVRCIIAFGATDVHGRSLTIGGALTAPLRVGVYPISDPVEGQLNWFGLAGWGPPGPDAFRAQGTGGTLTVESIAESGIRVSFHATARGPITYRGRLVAPLDGLSSFADLGPSCLTVGP
jgi:hypothetical protein